VAVNGISYCLKLRAKKNYFFPYAGTGTRLGAGGWLDILILFFDLTVYSEVSPL